MDPHAAALTRARELAAANRLAQARDVLTRLLRREPHHPHANAAMAFVALRESRADQAAFYAERSMAAAPKASELYIEAAKILGHAGRRDQAIAALELVVAEDPAGVNARVVLSNQYLNARRPAAAARVARDGLAHDPDNADLCNNLAMGLSHTGRSAEAAAILREAVRRHPSNLTLRSNFALTLNYCGGATPEEILQAHVEFGRMLTGQAAPAAPPPRPPDPERPLNVGFLSPDFVGHSVERFIGPVCENLDPTLFRVVCFSTGQESPGDMQRRPRVADYHVVSGLEDDALAAAIRDRGIDILVELSGHTAGGRLPVLCRRPAPVQMTYLGYPNTTGVPGIAFRMVDSLTDPVPDADSRATERLIRLDPCFLCFRPPADAPTAERGESPQPVVFASFNAASKFSEETVRLWTAVLQSVPGSRLVLKNWGLNEPESRADVTSRFVAAGLDPSRLELRGWAASPAEHLREYQRVDVALDTYPYHGTTTTAEALWMGVPVVTLVGESHASRVGLSLLNAVGLPDCAARSHDEFVRRASQLAGDHAVLASLRSGLRERVRSSVLCDAPAMGRRFGEALRFVWRDWCAGRRPPHR